MPLEHGKAKHGDLVGFTAALRAFKGFAYTLRQGNRKLVQHLRIISHHLFNNGFVGGYMEGAGSWCFFCHQRAKAVYSLVA